MIIGEKDLDVGLEYKLDGYNSYSTPKGTIIRSIGTKSVDQAEQRELYNDLNILFNVDSLINIVIKSISINTKKDLL